MIFWEQPLADLQHLPRVSLGRRQLPGEGQVDRFLVQFLCARQQLGALVLGEVLGGLGALH